MCVCVGQGVDVGGGGGWGIRDSGFTLEALKSIRLLVDVISYCYNFWLVIWAMQKLICFDFTVF